MNGTMRLMCALFLFAAALPVAAGAESLEQAKAFSGVNFGEAAGVSGMQAGAVDASRTGMAAQAAGLVADMKASQAKKSVVPPNPSFNEQQHRTASKVGNALGTAGTIALAFFAPNVLLIWAGIGAVMGLAGGLANHARGKQLAKATLGGAWSGFNTLANLGSALSAGTVHVARKLFGKE